MRVFMHWLGTYNLSFAWLVISIVLLAGFLIIRALRHPTPAGIGLLVIEVATAAFGIRIVTGRALLIPAMEAGFILVGVVLPLLLFTRDAILAWKDPMREKGSFLSLFGARSPENRNPGDMAGLTHASGSQFSGSTVTGTVMAGSHVAGSIAAGLAVTGSTVTGSAVAGSTGLVGSWSEEAWLSRSDMSMPVLNAAGFASSFEPAAPGVDAKVRVQLAQLLQDRPENRKRTALGTMLALDGIFHLTGDALLLLGWLLLEAGAPEVDKADARAAEVFARILRTSDVKMESAAFAHLGLGVSDSRRGRYEPALAHFAEAGVDERLAREAAVHSAKCHFLLKNPKPAIDALQRALESGEDPILLFMLGRAHLALNELHGADVAFSRAVRTDARFLPAWENLADCAERENRLQECVRCRRVLAECEPESPERMRMLAEALQRNGDLQESAAAFRQAVQLDPRSSRALFGFTLALLDTGKREEAGQTLERAMESDAPFEEIWHRLAQLRSDEGEMEEAIRIGEAAEKRWPESSRVEYNLGRLYLKTGQWKRAAECFQFVASGNNADEALYCLLAEALHGLHDFQRLTDAMREGLSQYPESRTLTLWLARARARRQNPAEAVSLLRSLLDKDPEMKTEILDCPDFSPLRNDPDFIRILRISPK